MVLSGMVDQVYREENALLLHNKVLFVCLFFKCEIYKTLQVEFCISVSYKEKKSMENNPSTSFRNKYLGYSCGLKLCPHEVPTKHKVNTGWIVITHTNHKSTPSYRDENFNHYADFLILLFIHLCVCLYILNICLLFFLLPLSCNMAYGDFLSIFEHY